MGEGGIAEIFDATVEWAGQFVVEEVPCLLCGGKDFIRLNSFVLNGRRLNTVRCRADGMMWLNPRPCQDFYDRLYAEHYHSTGPDDPLYEQATLDVRSDESELRRVAILRVNEIEDFAGRGRLLEVGFGSGHVLAEAQARGWQVLGLETSQDCVDAARSHGIPAVCASLPDYCEESGSFDVIAMYSVIEHSPDPRGYLRRARDLLKPDGLLVLRLPDTPADGPAASLIAHVWHFDKSTITRILEECHFEVLRIGAFGIWTPTKFRGGLPNMNVVSRRSSRTVLPQ